MQPAHHVAIDRWTGGGAEHLLFSGFEPFNVDWHPIVLTLNLRRVPTKALCDAAIALLFLLVRDLNEGRMTIGYGANRGYGSARVVKAAMTVPDTTDTADYRWLAGDVTKLSTLDQARLTTLQKGWTDWIDSPTATEGAGTK
jgi:hypothetical protein